MIDRLNAILDTFNLSAKCIDFTSYKSYHHYDIQLLNNAKIRDLIKIKNDIALKLKMQNSPDVSILGEKGLVRLVFNLPFSHKIPFTTLTPNNIPTIPTLGLKMTGEMFEFDISKQPHTLIAGTSGSGKSNLLHVFINNLIKYRKNLLFLVDPKETEFVKYQSINDTNVFSNYIETIELLDNLIAEMEERYSLIRNGTNPNNFTNIILIIDEFASLSLQDDTHKKLYKRLCFLAQKCRAAKIYIILSTQRPSANIIDGNIKANFPARISCKVASAIDSKVILDQKGAEELKNPGEAICIDAQSHFTKFQTAFVD